MRFLILILAALGAVANLAAQTQAQRAADDLAAQPALAHASLSVAVRDLAADTLVAAHNADLSCITASTMKTVTSSTALRLLGPDFVFTTPVALRGEVKKHKLKGDLVITGVGDPTLGSAYFPHNASIVAQIVDSLRARGISKIEGRIVVADSLIPRPGFNSWWDVGDLATDYGMGVHGVNYCDNRVRLRFRATPTGLDSLRLEPAVPGVQLINRLEGYQADRLDVFLEFGQPALVLAGSVKPRAYDWLVANPDPAALLADSLRRALATAGIKLKEKTVKVKTPATLPLVAHQSPRLSEIITSLLDRSDNMFTEALLRAVAAHSGRRATAAQGVAVTDSLWRASGLDVSPKYQYDGSGLARANKASARFFTSLLAHMAQHPVQGVTLASLMPQAQGRTGGLLRGTPLATDVVLKSGSMSQVQCFVGYYPAAAPRYAFAVLVNNWTGSRAAIKDHIARWLLSTFSAESGL